MLTYSIEIINDLSFLFDRSIKILQSHLDENYTPEFSLSTPIHHNKTIVSTYFRYVPAQTPFLCFITKYNLYRNLYRNLQRKWPPNAILTLTRYESLAPSHAFLSIALRLEPAFKITIIDGRGRSAIWRLRFPLFQNTRLVVPNRRTRS